MAASGFRWVVHPNELAKEVDNYYDRVWTAVMAIANLIATRAQQDMRANAAWVDRTGNARSGLFSVAEAAAKDIVHIYLSHGHTVFYGIYLELSNGQRFAIIAPTMQKLFPEIRRLLKQLFG